MTAQTMFTTGGLTWTKVPFPTAAEELRAVADSLKNVVLIACPGTVAHALAYNGIFYSTDEVQIVEADTGAEPNMMLWLKAADPGGSGAIIDVSMAATRAGRGSSRPPARTTTAESACPARWGGPWSRRSPPSSRSWTASPGWGPSGASPAATGEKKRHRNVV